MNGIDDIGGIFRTIMNDPQMLTKALSMATELKKSGIMDMFKGDSEQTAADKKQDEPAGHEGNENETPADEPKNDNHASASGEGMKSGVPGSLLSGILSGGNKYEKNNRRELIHALRPYLSEKRQHNADIIMNILMVLDIAGNDLSGSEKTR